MTKEIRSKNRRSPKAIICDWLNMYSGGDKANEFNDEADMLIRWLRDEGYWISFKGDDPEGKPDVRAGSD